MSLFNPDLTQEAQVLVETAAKTLVPALTAAVEPIVQRLAGEIARLGPALVDELDGLTVTMTISRKART